MAELARHDWTDKRLLNGTCLSVCARCGVLQREFNVDFNCPKAPRRREIPTPDRSKTMADTDQPNPDPNQPVVPPAEPEPTGQDEDDGDD